ncbi:phosphotransferase enzyme family protein [Rhodococcus sp. MEB064]|uniref:phosphotransferase enzyme family protein n=1 Tax=Rhodococcus sp. MEB064 TaxID=1587522 RepID=UPI0005AC8455|nr:phosphotransferase [Rhodococcus sp. MEB064]KIQ18443.1 hypothetical protein RU01_07680 [Rhodococcus sp. MEB064]
MTDQSATAEHAVISALVEYGLTGPVHLVKYRENHVFRLTNDRGDFAVRLHRAHYNDGAAIESELHLLRSLDQAGFSVPKVIDTKNGELFTSVRNGDVHQYVSVLEWVPEATPLGSIESGFDGSSTITPNAFRRCGELAGRLHNHLAGHTTITGDKRQAWDYEGLVGEHAIWGDPFELSEVTPVRDILDEASEALRAHLTSIGKTSTNYSVIHADMTPENILVADSTMTLIDFDDFGSGWHAFELATLLFWFQRHHKFSEFRDAAVSGYASTRGVIDDHMIAAMLFARGMTYLGWAARRRGDETAEFIAAQLVSQVVDNARDYLSATQRFRR